MKTWRRLNPIVFVVSLPLIIMLMLVVFSSSQPVSTRQEAQYAGLDQCAACHEEVVAAFKDTIHGKKGFELRSSHACETCHGPGKAHVDAGGGKGSMRTIASLTKEQMSEMCLTCHERGTKMLWEGSSHESRGLACQDCHKVHNPKMEKAQLKSTSESELCFSCHKQKQAQFFRASHHPIREGKMECSECHNPHGTQGEKLVEQASSAEKCYECHAEKRGPFLWEHLPVREDCSVCHEPHGTNHLKMLKTKQPFLCQRCHADTRHPGTIYDQNAVNSNSNRIFNRSCTNCHQTIHGSNHPSGKTFLR